MSAIELRTAVWGLPVTPKAKLVGLALVEHWSPKRQLVWPALGRLAGMTGLSVSSVQRGLAELETIRFIHRDGRRGSSSRFQIGHTDLSVTGHADHSNGQSDHPTPVSVTGDPGQCDHHPGQRDRGSGQSDRRSIYQEGIHRSGRARDPFGSSFENPEPIPPDFALPASAIAELAELHDVAPSVIESAVAEFRRYWVKDGGARTGWAAKCRRSINGLAAKGRLRTPRKGSSRPDAGTHDNTNIWARRSQ